MKPLAILGSLAALALSSCAYVQYSPYEGAAVAAEPSAGAFVIPGYSLPIYEGRPPRAFRVIGKIESSDRTMAPEGTDHAAVRVAKAKGADALIKLGKQSRYAGTEGGFSGWQTGPWSGGGYGWSRAQYTEAAEYLAIQWVQ